MEMNSFKKQGLFTAIALCVGSIIGSGWLFSAYYAAQYAGTASILAWLLGAVLALVLALLLAEISTMFQVRALFSRLLTISHNRDYGFVVAISNWLGLVITIPSEAEATVQYLSTTVPSLQSYLFYQHHLTFYGLLCVLFLLFIYGIINFWGIQSLAKANNIIAVFKIIIPITTSIILFYTVFHTSNFSMKYSADSFNVGHVFNTVIISGIFYAFYGFGTAAFFSSEINNPKRNVPLALVSSVIICLIIYLLLQCAFIGALPPAMVQNGWHTIHFISPLAQLLLLLNLNFWAMILYIDAVISPSGTACLYSGSAARNFAGMAKDKQMPSFFGNIHPLYHFSRSSLILTLLICSAMVLFFRNWQEIMLMVSVFQLMTCASIPIAFCKLRYSRPEQLRKFKMPLGKSLSMIIFLIISYLLIQAGPIPLILAFIMHVVLFCLYCMSFYKGNLKKLILAFQSSWTIFFYMITSIVFSIFRSENMMNDPIMVVFIVVNLVLFRYLVNQKNANNHTTADVIS